MSSYSTYMTASSIAQLSAKVHNSASRNREVVAAENARLPLYMQLEDASNAHVDTALRIARRNGDGGAVAVLEDERLRRADAGTYTPTAANPV